MPPYLPLDKVVRHTELYYSNFYRAVREDDRMPLALRSAPTPNPLLAAEGDESSMLAKLKTFTLVGIEALPVEVEVDVSPSGLPKQVHLGINHRKPKTLLC